MGQRLDLHTELVALLGTTNVYFQPPATLKMKYPCVIYTLADINSTYADNVNYTNRKKYTVIAVDTNPDSTLPESILDSFSYCVFDRHYTSDNLHHSVLTLYY
jgi:hypothetical protein